MKYSVVIPCYRSSKTIEKVVRLTALELVKLGVSDYEFVLVNDCSPDNRETYRALMRLAAAHDFVKVVDLSINAGQHNATMAGMQYADGDYIISMDDDMQTHPSQLHFLLSEIERGYDIVYGYYPEKKHTGFRNFGSWFNYMTVRVLIGKPKSMKTSSYWIIRKFVRDEAVKYTAPYAYLQGLFLRITRNISCIPIKHYERESGKSNYSFRALVKLWSNVLGFSIVPLKWASATGIVLSALGIISAIVLFIRKLAIPTLALGWSSVMVAIFFFSGLNLLFLGLVGEYIGRLYFSSNRAPQYVVREYIDRGEKTVGEDNE